MPRPVPGFTRADGVLTCDGVSLADVARVVGTPVHVYGATMLTERFRALDEAFSSVPHRLHYALKANATLEIVRRLRGLGAGADANSGGEIEVALRAGFLADEIVFTGVGKTPRELERAVALGLRAINAESPGEVSRIADIAVAQGREARIAIRINPDVHAGTHPHISTGARANKFGVSIDHAREMVQHVTGRAGLKLVGLHIHVGSQITMATPLEKAADIAATLASELQHRGIHLEHLDLGGGLGIPYEAQQTVLSPREYADALVPAVRRSGLLLLLEPGRWIVGPSGVLVTEVVDLKPGPDAGWFVIVDAGMTDLIRPALYAAHHGIEPVIERQAPAITADVVGPVCETSDTFGVARLLPRPQVGDLLAIRDTGAYGAVMASNYNRRPMAAEVLVEPGTWAVVRRRQTVDDMLQWDL